MSSVVSLVSGDGHHALLVNHDAVAPIKAAAVDFGVCQILDFLIAYADGFFCVADCINYHFLSGVVCRSLHLLCALPGLGFCWFGLFPFYLSLIGSSGKLFYVRPKSKVPCAVVQVISEKVNGKP